MTDLCAPFTLACRDGIYYVERKGLRERPAIPELVHLMNGGHLENDISYELMPWGEVWSFDGGWYDDPERILSLIGALKLRVERLQEQQKESEDNA